MKDKYIWIVIVFFTVIFSTILFLYFRLENVNNDLEYKIATLSNSTSEGETNLNLSINNLSKYFSEMSNSQDELTSSVKLLKENISILDSNYLVLNSDFEGFKEKYINLSVAYDKKSEAYNSLESDLLDLDSKIKEKMIWFTENNELNPAVRLEMSSTIRDVKEYCVKGDDVNLPCLTIFLNDDNYLYKSDNGDEIKSVNEFANEKGGDCEDWTVFIKAFLNEYKGRNLLIAEYSSGDKFDVYNDEINYWYYNDMKELSIPTDNENYFGVCYSTSSYGHCVLSLSQSNFIEDGDIVFEPQDGFYIGTVVKEDSKFYFNDGRNIYPLWIVITSNDIYVWDDGKNDWIYYKELDNKISEILENKSS